MKNTQQQGKLFIFSGPSGVGKGTICSELFKMQELNLAYSVSMTTRKQRPGEVEGINYFFVSPERFADAIKHDELIEYAEFVGNYYGTPWKYCQDMMRQGFNVLLEIEVQGALQVMAKCPQAISIFLIPPSLEELGMRIRSRNTESEELVLKRLSKAELELQLKYKYDYCVVNDTIDNAVKQIRDIIMHGEKVGR